ncbi:MAG: hypothetical protein DRO11_05595 [Methanobacteriota archaeon]|nr:MAG: hypothetical protein DRO11_05595 [Euryarchaeota archaeon]
MVLFGNTGEKAYVVPPGVEEAGSLVEAKNSGAKPLEGRGLLFIYGVLSLVSGMTGSKLVGLHKPVVTPGVSGWLRGQS